MAIQGHSYADSKYSADQGTFPHISAGHVCKQTLQLVCNLIAEPKSAVRNSENLTKMAIQGHQGHVLWSQWKGDTGLNNTT